jgi:hypothetical protein
MTDLSEFGAGVAEFDFELVPQKGPLSNALHFKVKRDPSASGSVFSRAMKTSVDERRLNRMLDRTALLGVLKTRQVLLSLLSPVWLLIFDCSVLAFLN